MNTQQTTLELGKLFTYSGRIVNIFDPDPSDIDIYDIAKSLGHICRYGGQCREFYSVADHSTRIVDLVEKENGKWALLHDAAEAYIGDLPAPLKYHSDFSFYKDLENNLMNAICDRFGMDYEEPEEVKYYDMVLRVTEMRDLTSISEEWYNGYIPLKYKIKPNSPQVSEQLYIEYARMLGLL